MGRAQWLKKNTVVTKKQKGKQEPKEQKEVQNKQYDCNINIQDHDAIGGPGCVLPK